MGTLHYGTSDETCFAIDDETLTHLAAIVVAKLRRQEAFLLSIDSDHGRESLWIHPASMLRWSYAPGEQPALDRDRLDVMMRHAHRPGGLSIAAAAPVAAIELAAA